MQRWTLPLLAGIALGLLSFFAPGLWQASSIDQGETLESLNKKELHKKIEGMKLSAIRLASDGRYSEAIPQFLHLIDINHHDQFSYVQLAKVLRDIGEKPFIELIATSAERAVVIDKERILGAVYFQSNKWKEAKEHLYRFLRQSPQDLAATYYLGAIALREGDFDRAEKMLTDVIKREETYYFAYMDLLDLSEKQGDQGKADAYLKLAWKYNPVNNKEGVCCGLPLTKDQKKR